MPLTLALHQLVVVLLVLLLVVLLVLLLVEVLLLVVQFVPALPGHLMRLAELVLLPLVLPPLALLDL